MRSACHYLLDRGILDGETEDGALLLVVLGKSGEVAIPTRIDDRGDNESAVDSIPTFPRLNQTRVREASYGARDRVHRGGSRSCQNHLHHQNDQKTWGVQVAWRQDDLQ